MTNNLQIYYNRNNLLYTNIVKTILIVYLSLGPFPQKNFDFLNNYPGIYISYACATVIAASLIYNIPYIFNSLMKIPAIEFKNNAVTTRGWREKIFKIDDNDAIEILLSTNALSIESSSGNSFKISKKYLSGRQIDFDNLKNLLDSHTK